MNVIQNKIQVTSRVVAILTKILYIAMIVVVCFELAGVLWLTVSPDVSSILLGGIRIISPFSLIDAMGIRTDLLTGVVSQCFFIAILISTNRIFKNISRVYSPFTPETVRGMRRITLLLLIDGIVAPQVDSAIQKSISLATGTLYSSSDELIILAIILYCFSLIFQYGVELQRQSDETL